ncbi:iron complex outermembrane receptor protein [Novosphingobium chloroacetimidivorans]|uniref:Iron complex outermembrane receptor protein n=1 Tax=Novosphingobium chloroacetimidivorans TaxID=1428314 RepID=A0A7W7KDL7_9SPHN|nr:TonB-dependent receptor [Novosphingobium chloroacetimidivorans]MBB4860293.1 iron complex outermembrane receptor protein [Novosphingobium chloroacetimidivorans]
MRIQNWTSIGAIVSALCASSVAMAAQPAPGDASSEAVPQQATRSDNQVEEIVVTAQRRETNLQDTPIAITALSSAALDARGVKNIGNLENFVPNLQINQGRPDGGGSTAAITIRGVGQNDAQFPNDPGVGLYVDGVYSARSYGGLIGLLDIERIEVLRGPQGTLFGRNTIGGAVNIVTTPPSQDFGGHVSLLYGSYNRFEAKASINAPLIEDKLALRVSAGFTRADGLGEQLTTGRSLSNENRKSIRLALRATPSDDVTIDLVADYTRQRQNPASGTIITTVPSTTGLIEGLFNPVIAGIENPAAGLPAGSRFDNRFVTRGRYDNFGTAPLADNLNAGGAALTVTWKASDALTIKSITAGRAYKAHIALDQDYSPYSIISTDDRQHQEQYSQELQAFGTAIDGKLHYLAGLYYFKEIARDYNRVAIVPNTLPVAGFEIAQIGDLGLNATNYAAFGQIDYDLLDNLTVTVGVRQNHEEKRFTRQFTHLQGGDVFIPYQVLQKGWNSFTPRLGVNWKATPDVMLYANYAAGFKGGGWTPRPTSAASGVKPFEPEKIKTFEIGAKTQWFDRRLTFNVAGFYSRYKNIQFPVAYGLPDGTLVIETQNAGESEIKGIEAELVARPIPNSSIQIGYGYFHNKYVSIVPGASITASDRLPDAPTHTLNLGADYRFDLGQAGNLTMRADAAYRSRVFKDAVNTPLISQPGFWLVSGRVTWTSPSDTFSVQVYGNNLFDKKYLASGFDASSLGLIVGYYGRPREFGVQGTYKF